MDIFQFMYFRYFSSKWLVLSFPGCLNAMPGVLVVGSERREDQNKWRCRSITILCRILVCFFLSSKWAEFLHVVSNLIEKVTALNFFSAGLRFVFQLKRMQKNSAAHFAVCCWTTSKRNLLFSRTMKSAKRPVAVCFLHTFLLKNDAQTRGKKYRQRVPTLTLNAYLFITLKQMSPNLVTFPKIFLAAIWQPLFWQTWFLKLHF